MRKSSVCALTPSPPQSHFETEIPLRVAVGNIANEISEEVHVAREVPVDDVAGDQVAEDAPEIFVPRKRKKTARIRQHSYAAAQQPEIRKCIELPFHPLLLVEVPPAAAELHFSGRPPILEIADH